MTITLIACTDINMGLGDEKGNLLFDLPKDMEHFVKTTTGQTVVMGRKTWDSLPKKPLKNRKNIVLTKTLSVGELTLYRGYDNVEVYNSIEDVLELAKTEHVFVIGGGEIYNQFIKHADEILMTHVHNISSKAVTFFPSFDFEEWKLVKVVPHEADEHHKYSFNFATYTRK